LGVVLLRGGGGGGERKKRGRGERKRFNPYLLGEEKEGGMLSSISRGILHKKNPWLTGGEGGGRSFLSFEVSVDHLPQQGSLSKGWREGGRVLSEQEEVPYFLLKKKNISV